MHLVLLRELEIIFAHIVPPSSLFAYIVQHSSKHIDVVGTKLICEEDDVPVARRMYRW